MNQVIFEGFLTVLVVRLPPYSVSLRVVSRPCASLVVLLACLSSLALGITKADAQGMSISLPSATADSCQDYFTTEWNNPLDMNDESDILYNLVPREYFGMNKMSYANGLATTTTTTIDPSFRLLTWVDHASGAPVAIPDDTTRFGVNRPIAGGQSPFYDTLSMRMYTDKASHIQVYFEKQDGSYTFTEPFSTYGGWHVYNLNLRTLGAQLSAGDSSWATSPVTAIRVDPTGQNSASLTLDWIQLTPDATLCPSATLNYTRSAAGYVTMVIDDDTNPSNGIVYRSPLQTAASGSVSVSSTKVFPGAYKVYGFVTSDYATSNVDPWDMDSGGTDVVATSMNNIDPASVSYSTGAFCATTSGTDPYVFLNIPQDKPISASSFTRLSFDLSISSPLSVQVLSFGSGSTLKTVSPVNANASGRYNVNLGALGGWTGDVYGLRFDFGDTPGTSFCFDNVTLATSNLASIPSPTYTSALNLTFKERTVATFAQPDKEGGLDYFVREKNNPSNFNSGADVTFASNLSSLTLYPGNVYTDSGGAVRTGDYVEGVNTVGSDDVNVGSVMRGPPIDPDFYRIACFDLDVLKATDVYHSVARILWFRDDQPINGDDLVLKTTGEKRYCLRMDTLQYEGQGAGGPHPWRANSDGTGINYFRVDPHEESDATTFRMADVRLASDHLANSRYAFVINGAQNKTVDVYVSPAARSTAGGTLIGSLAAGRASQVLLWDSSSTPEGYLYPYLVVDGNTYYADAPVRVSRSFSDTTAPVLGVYTPMNGYRFINQIQVAGHVLDDTRVATVEVLVDGSLVGSISPSLYNKGVRDSYPTYPYASHAGFNQFIDLSALSDGDHTVKVVAYDTAGNTTESTGTVTKSPSNPSDEFAYPVPNEAPQSLATLITPTPAPAELRVTKATVSSKGTLELRILGTGASDCAVDLSLGKSAKAASNSVKTYTFTKTKVTMTAAKQFIHKKAGTVYVFANRRCNLSRYNASTSRKLTFRASNGRIKSLKSLASSLKKSLKVSG